MTSIEGKNVEVFSKSTDFGLRVEGIFNYCESESAESGKDLWHGLIEVIDDRGGIAVSVQVIPVFPEGAHDHTSGHFTDTTSADVADAAGRVFAAFDDNHIPPEQLIRAAYAASVRTEQDMMMSALMSVFGADEDDDFDTTDGSDEDFMAGLLGLGGLLGS